MRLIFAVLLTLFLHFSALSQISTSGSPRSLGTGLVAVYYSGIAVKAGDTLTNPTTRTAFASKWTMPANSSAVGDLYRVDFYGRYQIPTGAISPLANPCLQIGGANVVCTGNLTVGVGTGINYGFNGTIFIVVRSIGSSCVLVPVGSLLFQLTGGNAPTQAGVIPDTANFTGNCTIANDWTLTNLTSNNAGQTFTLDFLLIQKAVKPAAAN